HALVQRIEMTKADSGIAHRTRRIAVFGFRCAVVVAVHPCVMQAEVVSELVYIKVGPAAIALPNVAVIPATHLADPSCAGNLVRQEEELMLVQINRYALCLCRLNGGISPVRHIR